jgi:hypothetical protein
MTTFDQTFSGRLTRLLIPTLKNKIVKKPTRKENERVFPRPEKQRQNTSTENGAGIFINLYLRNQSN